MSERQALNEKEILSVLKLAASESSLKCCNGLAGFQARDAGERGL